MRPTTWEEKMPDKLVHLSDEAHQMAQEFCRKQGITMKQWVSELILEANNKDILSRIVKAYRTKDDDIEEFIREAEAFLERK